MSKSKFVIDRLAKLFEQGLISYKDLNNEILNILKSKKDEIIFKLDLPTKEELEILKKRIDFLEKKIELALSEGIKLNRIAIDPGFGFGKSPLHNMQIIAWLPMFQSLGVPVLLGGSRKSSIGVLSNNELPENRLGGSIALLCYANLYGTQMIRVHDVLESKQAINISTHINKQI